MKVWLCALAAIVILAAGCSEEPPTKDLVRPVRAVRVADSDGLTGRTFPGTARATEEINLAFEVQGRMIERPVNLGDKVEKDQALARLDPRDYANALDAALAREKSCKAQFERMSRSYESRAVSKQDLDNAEALYESAKAEVKIRGKALEDCVLCAPFDGEIAAVFVENFENVQAKQLVMRLLDTSRVEMTINIPEALITNAPYVKDIMVEFDAFPGKHVPARIKEVGSEASMTTRTYPLTLIMDQPADYKILSGMAGRAQGRVVLSDDPAEGVDIPTSAMFVGEDGGDYIWAIDEAAMTVSRLPVEVKGVTSRGIKVSGLEAGRLIATAGVHFLHEGQKVSLLDGHLLDGEEQP